MDIKELQAKMTSTVSEMEALDKQIELEKDEAKGKDLRSKLEGKSKEFDALEVDFKRKQEILNKRNSLPKQEDGKADLEGKSLFLDPQIKNEKEDHEAHMRGVADILSGKAFSQLPGKVQEMLAPTNREALEAGECRFPESFASKVFGKAEDLKRELSGKSLPMVSTNQGQYVVFPEYKADLLQLPFPKTALLDYVTKIPTKGGNVYWPRLSQTSSNEFGGVSFTWGAEGSSKGDTEAVFEQLNIQTNEVNGYTEISETMLRRSSIPLESLLATLFREGISYEIDQKIIKGSGSGQPYGIVGFSGVSTSARVTSKEVRYEDLLELKHGIPPQFRQGCKFIVGDDVEKFLEKQKDLFGRPLFRASMADGPVNRLLDFDYDVVVGTPSLGKEADIIFLNPKWYFLAVEQEITFARSADYKFKNNLIAFKIHAHVGGKPAEPRAISILNGDLS